MTQLDLGTQIELVARSLPDFRAVPFRGSQLCDLSLTPQVPTI